MLRIELPASLCQLVCLLEEAPIRVLPSQCAKRLGKGNFRAWVTAVQHVYRFFKGVDPFDETTLKAIKQLKWMYCLIDIFDTRMLDGPRPSGANILKLRLDFYRCFALPAAVEVLLSLMQEARIVVGVQIVDAN